MIIFWEYWVASSRHQDGFAAPLFDDNPAVLDLLGGDAVADAVTRVVTAGGLDPVTVGIHSAWGGGKSTALNLVAARLESFGHVVVVRVDPWEFENAEDLRGTLIAQVLDELQNRVEQTAEESPKRKQVLGRLKDLRRRIAWSRVAGVLVTSAVKLSPDLPGLIEALTPEPKKPDSDADTGVTQGMAGFRTAFENLMKDVGGIKKVVVLVDDLDRCLPPTIMATLEAIKLFLSVKGMAFVLAADEVLIREAIGVHLEGAARGGFAQLYTEKIIQLPITLPVLSAEQAEAYIALLLCKNAGELPSDGLDQVIESARQRRLEGKAPYVVDHGDGSPSPSGEHLRLAARIAGGLAADVWRSPRAIKRFLNALAVREHLARAGGAELELEVLLKLYLLEVRHLNDFRLLSQKTSHARVALLGDWEGWALDESLQPPEVSEETKSWAASEPSLTGHEAAIERYLSVAATLLSDVHFGGAVTGALMRIIEKLTNASDSTRAAGVLDAKGLEPAERLIVVNSLGDQLTRLSDVGPVIESLVAISEDDKDLTEAVSVVLNRPTVFSVLEPHHVVYLSRFRDVLNAIVATAGLDADVVEAARQELSEPPH
ncbi:P-loop NTPase fold protein [Actinoplanes sp. NPDC026623]|uniref:KAP family P-loop NTPase fold protein n=1 Tax=Actinoplanes sp. NPDC026623 TaxID=3155610 RepID=UPI00340A0365